MLWIQLGHTQPSTILMLGLIRTRQINPCFYRAFEYWWVRGEVNICTMISERKENRTLGWWRMPGGVEIELGKERSLWGNICAKTWMIRKIWQYKHMTERFQGRRNSSEPFVEGSKLSVFTTEMTLWQCRKLVTVELGQVSDPR